MSFKSWWSTCSFIIYFYIKKTFWFCYLERTTLPKCSCKKLQYGKKNVKPKCDPHRVMSLISVQVGKHFHLLFISIILYIEHTVLGKHLGFAITYSHSELNYCNISTTEIILKKTPLIMFSVILPIRVLFVFTVCVMDLISLDNITSVLISRCYNHVGVS